MITAKEAKELAISKLKTTETVFETIRAMADSGYFSATFDKTKLLDKEATKTAVIEQGYVVDETELHLTINW